MGQLKDLQAATRAMQAAFAMDTDDDDDDDDDGGDDDDSDKKSPPRAGGRERNSPRRRKGSTVGPVDAKDTTKGDLLIRPRSSARERRRSESSVAAVSNPSQHISTSRIDQLKKVGFSPPEVWTKFMGKLAKKKKGNAMPLRQARQLVMNIYMEKIKADAVDMREGTPIEPLPEFTINNLLFKFGTKKLVQARLHALYLSTRANFKKDRLLRSFARFAGVAADLPLDCLTKALRAVDVCFQSNMPALKGKEETLNVEGLRCFEAFKALGAEMPTADLLKAEERLAIVTLMKLPGGVSGDAPTTGKVAPKVSDRKPRASPRAPDKADKGGDKRGDKGRPAALAVAGGAGGPGGGAGNGSPPVGGAPSPLQSPGTAKMLGGGALGMAARLRRTASQRASLQSAGSDSSLSMRELKEAKARAKDDVADTMVFLKKTSSKGGLKGDWERVEQDAAARKLQRLFRRRLEAVKNRMRRRETIQRIVRKQVDIVDFIEVFVDMWIETDRANYQLAMRLFEEADDNGDGVLEFHEFEVLIQKLYVEMGGNPFKTVPMKTTRKLYMDATMQSEDGSIKPDDFAKMVREKLPEVIKQHVDMSFRAVPKLVPDVAGVPAVPATIDEDAPLVSPGSKPGDAFGAGDAEDCGR